MSTVTQENVFATIEKGLNIQGKKKVTLSTSMDNTPEWDSLGHLGILSGLDALTGGKVANISEMATASSVKDIMEILKSHSLV